MLYSAIKIIWSILSVSIIFLVLLHSPKGDGVAGIGGQAQMFSSTRSAEASLNRLTWSLVVAFLALSIMLSAGWVKPDVVTTSPTLTVPSQTVPPTLPAETAPQPNSPQ
ncbi:MAG: preprotein translocase subunit SecG [Pseudanabaenaceae cyanobacterium bins.68]|nr:preprotein translocase subunit SecG [Pseudanabaenaceae cyanobacterium bins.68]